MAKAVKSVRLSEEVIALVEQQEGVNFSDKLDRLLYRSCKELPLKQRELKAVTEQIAFQHIRLSKITAKITEFSRYMDNLTGVFQSAELQATRVARSLEGMMPHGDDCNG